MDDPVADEPEPDEVMVLLAAAIRALTNKLLLLCVKTPDTSSYK